MPILCYSTTIAADRSVTEIQRRLAQAGASHVMAEYAERRPVALAFILRVGPEEIPYRLPARVDGVLRALESERRGGRVSRSQATRDHAERVAWRIALEWLKVQLAVIQSGLVTLDEVFLPYRQIEGGATVYEAVRDRRLALSLPGPGA